MQIASTAIVGTVTILRETRGWRELDSGVRWSRENDKFRLVGGHAIPISQLDTVGYPFANSRRVAGCNKSTARDDSTRWFVRTPTDACLFPLSLGQRARSSFIDNRYRQSTSVVTCPVSVVSCREGRNCRRPSPDMYTFSRNALSLDCQC